MYDGNSSAARSVAEYFHVGAVDKDPPTPSTRCFFNDSKPLELIEGRVDGRHGQSAPLHCRGGGQVRAGAHGLVNLEDRSRTFRLPYDAFAIAVEQPYNLIGSLKGLFRCFGNPLEKKLEPRFPGAVFADFLQQAVIIGPTRFEIEAEVKKGLSKYAGGAKEQRDQEPTEAAIAVQERMDGFKLYVKEPRLDQGGMSGVSR